jgi:hypothetical protein
MLSDSRLWYEKSPEKQPKVGREGVEPSPDFSERILRPSRFVLTESTLPYALILPCILTGQCLLSILFLLLLVRKLHLSYTKVDLDAPLRKCTMRSTSLLDPRF